VAVLSCRHHQKGLAIPSDLVQQLDCHGDGLRFALN
jgi:hypothetical protein